MSCKSLPFICGNSVSGDSIYGKQVLLKAVLSGEIHPGKVFTKTIQFKKLMMLTRQGHLSSIHHSHRPKLKQVRKISSSRFIENMLQINDPNIICTYVDSNNPIFQHIYLTERGFTHEFKTKKKTNSKMN